MGGLVGSIVIQPFDPFTLPGNLGLIKHNQLVFTYFQGHNSMISTDSNVISNDIWSYSRLSNEAGSTMPINPTYLNNNIHNAWFTNGQYQPTKSMQPGEWVIFDIVAASGDRILEIEIRDDVGLSNGEQVCDMRLLSLDGIYLNQARTGSNARHLPIIQGSRASIAVMCSTLGTYYLQTATTIDAANPFSNIGEILSKSSQNLLILKIEGQAVVAAEQTPPPMDLSSISRPSYLNSLVSIDNLPLNHSKIWSIGLEQQGCCPNDNTLTTASKYWLGIGKDCTLPCLTDLACKTLYGPDYSVSFIPSVTAKLCAYSSYQGSSSELIKQNLTPTYRHNAVINETEQVTIWGRDVSVSHPFHLHVNHFQILSYDNHEGTGDSISLLYGNPGDWRDTYPSLPGKTTIRMKYTDFPTERIIHDSFLIYEDLGLISSFSVSLKPPHVVILPEIIPEIIPDIIIPDVNVPEIIPIISNSASNYNGSVGGLCDVKGSSFSYLETIDIRSRIRTITTNSCPNHFSVCQSEECGGEYVTHAAPQQIVWKLPLYPSFAKKNTDTTCTTNVIAVALNGVGIMGQSDGKTSICGTPAQYGQAAEGRTSCGIYGESDGTKYCGDAVVGDGKSFDKCGGHANSKGLYHYHVVPTCLMSQLAVHTTVDSNIASSHLSTFSTFKSSPIVNSSPQIGWALDGFPIYGPLGPYGTLMMPCGSDGAHPNYCLDICNGFEGVLKGIDDFVYRYYISGEVGDGECNDFIQNGGDCTRISSKCCISTLPRTVFKPYTIGCFRGCPIGTPGCVLSGIRGTTETYLPKVSSYVTSVFNESIHKISNTQSSSPILNQQQVDPIVDNNIISIANINNYGAPKVAIRIPNNRSISISTFSSSSSGVSETTYENLAPGKDDTFISGIAINEATNTMYYATQDGLYSIKTVGPQDKTHLVAGILSITINGYNFGNSVNDIRALNIRGVPCTSVIFVSSNQITCLSVKPGVIGTDINSDDVYLSVLGGSTQGIYFNPEVVIRSNSGRPIIANINFEIQPFLPYALSIRLAETNNDIPTLYWSNIAIGGYSIQRCRLDGTQIETVLTDVQRSLGLVVSTPEKINGIIREYSDDVLFFTDTSKGTISRFQVPCLKGDKYIYNNISIGRLSRTVIMSGLEIPTGITIEISTNSIFASIFDGTVIYLKLSMSMSIGGNNDKHVAAKVDLRIGKRSLPAWSKIAIRGSSKSRFTSVVALPVCISNVNINLNCPLKWQQQRIFALDTNQQMIYTTSENGFPLVSMDVTKGFGIKSSIAWPIAITNSITYTDHNGDTAAILYIAEFLGKIWKLKLPYSSDGTLSKSLVIAPEILLDLSKFPSSEKIRNYIRSARDSGVNSAKLISFEILG